MTADRVGWGIVQDRWYQINNPLSDLKDFIEVEAARRLAPFEYLELDGAKNRFIEAQFEQDPRLQLPDPDGEDIAADAYSAWESECHRANRVRLEVLSMAFAYWEKSVRTHLNQGVGDWPDVLVLQSKIQTASVNALIEFYDGCGWHLRDLEVVKQILVSQHIVNAFKHGEGHALDTLRREHKDYVLGHRVRTYSLEDAESIPTPPPWHHLDLWGQGYLYISSEELTNRLGAFLMFWRERPKDLWWSDVERLKRWPSRNKLSPC